MYCTMRKNILQLRNVITSRECIKTMVEVLHTYMYYICILDFLLDNDHILNILLPYYGGKVVSIL